MVYVSVSVCVKLELTVVLLIVHTIELYYI